MKLGDLTGVPLPNGTAGSRTATSEQDGGANLAWRREMERAQSDAWFLGTLPTPSTTRQTAALPSAATAKPVHAAVARSPAGHSRDGAAAKDASIEPRASHGEHPATSSTAARHASASSAQQTPPAGAGIAAVRTMAISTESAVQLRQSPDLALRLTALTTPRGALEVPVEVHIGAPAEEPPATAEDRSTAAPRAGRLPVRVHVEGDAMQSTVWLGVDAAALAQLPGLAAAVRRWLMNAGYGTPSWICNGQPMSAEQIAEGAESGVADARDARLPHRSPPMTFVLNQPPGETV